MATLNQQQFKALARAITDAFDQDELRSLLQLECGKVLANVVALPMPWGPLVTQVVLQAQKQEFVAELVLAVAAWRPRNVVLATVLRELTQAPGAESTLALSEAARGTHADNVSALQGLVRAAAQWANYDQFLADLALLGPRVCRIEAADDGDVAYGTGFLVGDDLVMTNDHVRLGLRAGGTTPACRFDYRQLAGSQEVRNGIVVPAADGADAWVAWSPFAMSDTVEGGTPPTAEQLDYALLRLTEPVGSFPPGQDAANGAAKPRGHYALTPAAAPLALGADVLIAQHPAGLPLKLAVGQMTAGDIAFRCAHDAPTQGGSSGSPCFDLKLTLRALHHGTDPRDPNRPRFNQAVPIHLIVADLIAKGKLP